VATADSLIPDDSRNFSNRCHVDRPVDDLPVADLDHDGVDEHDGIDAADSNRRCESWTKGFAMLYRAWNNMEQVVGGD
jgi:hypothetical protein